MPCKTIVQEYLDTQLKPRKVLDDDVEEISDDSEIEALFADYIKNHPPKIVLEKVSIPKKIHSPTPEVSDGEPEVIDDESSAETIVIDSENEDTNGLGEDSETESNIVIVPTVYKNDAVKPGPKSKLKPKPKEIWWCSPKKGNTYNFNCFVFN